LATSSSIRSAKPSTSDGAARGEVAARRHVAGFQIFLDEQVANDVDRILVEQVGDLENRPALFDAKTIKAPATRTQPKQFPIGIDYVIVNGQVVVDSGKHTGMRAGRALRRGRAST
jgi:hypothetical protein